MAQAPVQGERSVCGVKKADGKPCQNKVKPGMHVARQRVAAKHKSVGEKSKHLDSPGPLCLA